MGNQQSIGNVVIIKYNGEDYEIFVNRSNPTMQHLKDTIFSDFQLSSNFKQYYCMATQSSASVKNTMRYLGASVFYSNLTTVEKQNLKLLEAPLFQDYS